MVLAHRPDSGDGVDQDAEDRDQAYAEAGWQVRTAPDWDPHELIALLTGPVSAEKEDEENDG